MQYIYSFGRDTQGNKDMKEILGGKGANLAEMSNIGIPVPPGFTISTEACNYYTKHQDLSTEIIEEIEEKLKKLEEETGKIFGSPKKPLLLSVRSGAAVSMPGMMDTILNLGTNDDTIKGLAKMTSERTAWDSYRRFVQMFGEVVLKVEAERFEELIQDAKDDKGVDDDLSLDSEDLKELVSGFKKLIDGSGKDFPEDPKQQLMMSIKAVFGSWNNKRAIKYRKMHDIAGIKGTAVNVQAMVFGNMGEGSCTGVCFTRNPGTGENKLYGEYLLNAQGEDVVAGTRTPKHIDDLEKEMPKISAQLKEICNKLEDHYKEMQDIEFTVEEGKLFILQSRTGKRTANAGLRIAVEMEEEGMIGKKEAILRIDPENIEHVLHKQLDPNKKDEAKLLGKGLGASPGAAVGRIVFTADDAIGKKQDKVILVRTETSPEDIGGMEAAQGILTSRGGMTSHAAVVARGMGKCCVVGCEDAKVDSKRKILKIGRISFEEGDIISLDGHTGEVFKGEVSVVDPDLSDDFQKVMEWADSFRKLKVRTNADNGADSKKAIEFGAEGIGLCRTEHMFFNDARIDSMREMIFADSQKGRKKALAKIIRFQTDDFKEIFSVMGGRPVTIRLLDPPFHEFLPEDDRGVNKLANDLGITEEDVKKHIADLRDVNPMLGHRGCRLGINYPEITEMQTKAIIQAAIDMKEMGVEVKPEIMVPLVGISREFEDQRDVVKKTADSIIQSQGTKVDYLVGTMIEVPRAALTAGEIAKHADFFSFGTNDLTQMTYGYSRDDAGKFISQYLEKGILDKDPFQVLDQEGVGQLVEMAFRKGRQSNSNLKVGICGEHGGDPSSVKFCHKVGLDYVSCSPFRVPIARLAAAHAALRG